MAKEAKRTAKIERARARAQEELDDARAKADRKINRARKTLKLTELKIEAALQKTIARIERRRSRKNERPTTGHADSQ